MKSLKILSLVLFSFIIYAQTSFSQNNDEASQLLQLINSERKKSSLNEYKTEPQLQNAANQRAKEISEGIRKTTALQDNNIQFASYAEGSIIANVTAEEIFNEIMKSQDNLVLNKTFTHAAVGVYEQGDQKYWVMLYVSSRNGDIIKKELNIQKERERVTELCNEARKQNNVSVSLVLDSKLSEAAQKRAEELKTLFSHRRPNKKAFSTILREYNITYITAGENIANGQADADDVMKSWLNSSGHRANILQKNFGKIGVGVFEYNNRLYWVQVFTD
ncbi:CAP domain-containing protein [Brachyspira hampsonii]|uniref:CAP domain-containing protein n=1 Tax=Brachyspira hampsonii TaxID=1287055 RepID=UPI001CA4E790|nr:CAP domain-containing protein [Brachyspira hampsonii]MBW5389930.1 CAP domain-containing protein [Brachyspira hampsonii]